ncbi:MAG: permease-like cell division protein FtsX [Lachnospiraceae bacterium]|jgi:cell division transport system permease protein|nr:permease-like cell division protein FtsX [Lachnospiraceae bacterium]
MKISTFFYTLWQGVRNLFRNGWYSLASISTIAACLFLFGLFFSVVFNIRNILLTAEEAVSITVFFNDDVSEERVKEIGEEIKKRTEVASVQFHDDDEIWAEFGEAYYGPDYAEGFPENPLEGDHNYEVFLSDVSMQDTLVNWLQSKSEIRKVNYSEVTADTLTGVNSLIAYVSIAIIAILLAVSIFLISNTVRVGISVRAEEISIMKYVGATDFFVRAPFVLEGMLIGLIGSVIPLLLIHELYDYVISYVTERFAVLSSMLNFLQIDEIFKYLMPVCLIVGVGIGFIGSLATVRKHLRV